MHLAQRRATLLLLILETIAAALGLLALRAMDSNPSAQQALIVALPVLTALAFAYWRGWELARYVNLLIALFLVCGPFLNPQTDRSFSPVIFVPPALAIVTAGPWWIGGTALTALVVLNLRGGGFYARPDNIIIVVLVIVCMIVGRLIVDRALRTTEDARAEAEREHDRAVAEARLRAEQADELARQNAEQSRLVSLVATLETPVIALADDILLAPLVGTFNVRRLTTLTEKLLRQVAARRAQLLILDISGLPGLDPEIIDGFAATARAVQLLGCRVAISGISATFALAMAERGAMFPGTITTRSPYDAIRAVQERSPASGIRPTGASERRTGALV